MQVLCFFAVVFLGILGAAVFLRIIYCAVVSVFSRKYKLKYSCRNTEKPLLKERNDK